MRIIISLFLLFFLSSCETNTVLTPYAYTGKNLESESARVWGGSNKEGEIYFVKVNGDKLPSRGLAGLPMSLSLIAGSYDIQVVYLYDNEYSYIDIKLNVIAGHTYVINYEKFSEIGKDFLGFSGKQKMINLSIEDLGTDKKCHLKRIDAPFGMSSYVELVYD